MNETQVKYRDWELYSDKKTTQQNYKVLEHSEQRFAVASIVKKFRL